MESFDTLVAALNGLKEQGYTVDFNLNAPSIHCPQKEKDYQPEDLVAKKTFRFEGESNPSDSSVLFAIEAEDGTKGTLVSGYGPDSAPENEELLRRICIEH